MAGVEVSSEQLLLFLGLANVFPRPRGAHVSPERWNKVMRHERQSSCSDEEPDSDELSSREPSPEHLTPTSLVGEAATPTKKPSNHRPMVAASNADASDGEAEYLASEEEEYEVDPFEHDLSDGLSSEDASSDAVCKTESRDADHVKNENKSDELSPPKIENEESARYNSWNCDGFSNPFASKLSSGQVPDQVYSKPIHVRATPFGQKVLNAMRQSRTELEHHTSNAAGEALTPQSLYERPSSPSDAALFKASTLTTSAKAEASRAPLIHEETVKPPMHEEESNYPDCAPAIHRRGSSSQPCSFTTSNVPEILNMAQSYYQAPFHMPSYHDSVEPITHKNEEASFDPFGYGTYSQPSRPTAPLIGHRFYPHVYSQQCPPNEVVATNNLLSPPHWRNSYASSNPLSQPQALPTRASENAEPFLNNNPSSGKPTVLTISEIVSDSHPELPSEAIHGTKRKADDMVGEDINDYEVVNFEVHGNKADTSDVVYNDIHSQEDTIDTIKQPTPDSAVRALGTQPYPNDCTPEVLMHNAIIPMAVNDNNGPVKKKARTKSSPSMLKTTRTFVSGMLAGGLSVFGALLVYGATAPDSIQDRVRLEFA